MPKHIDRTELSKIAVTGIRQSGIEPEKVPQMHERAAFVIGGDTVPQALREARAQQSTDKKIATLPELVRYKAQNPGSILWDLNINTTTELVHWYDLAGFLGPLDKRYLLVAHGLNIVTPDAMQNNQGASSLTDDNGPTAVRFDQYLVKAETGISEVPLYRLNELADSCFENSLFGVLVPYSVVSNSRYEKITRSAFTESDLFHALFGPSSIRKEYFDAAREKSGKDYLEIDGLPPSDMLEDDTHFFTTINHAASGLTWDRPFSDSAAYVLLRGEE